MYFVFDSLVENYLQKVYRFDEIEQISKSFQLKIVTLCK